MKFWAKREKKIFLTLFLSIFFCQLLVAQIDTLPNPAIDFFLSQSKLKSDPNRVSIASFSPQTLRETPGIVSLITAEDIKNMGVRDLQEVLRLVPGFETALDVSPVLTFRGNATNEAKMLITIDGVPINDNSFGFNYILNRFPLVNVARIEIIRGPGSAIYGGMAGLGVVNIITKSSSSTRFESKSESIFGAASTGFMRQNIGFFTNFRPSEKVEISLSAASMNQQMSNIDYESFAIVRGTVSNRENFNRVSYLNASFQIKNFSVRYIHSSFRNRLPHIGSSLLSNESHLFRFDHRAYLSSKISVFSTLNIRYLEPFLFADIPTLNGIRLDVFDVSAIRENRVSANSYAIYRPNQSLTFVAGTEVLNDRARYIKQGLIFRDSSSTALFNGFSFFGEASLSSRLVNLTFGGRFEKYADVTPVLVPRIALTKAFTKLHFKAIYNQAFKTPTILNIKNARRGYILPERFNQIEFEVGWKFSDQGFININAYDLTISDYILRRDNVSAEVDFDNAGNSRTQGVEVEFGYKRPLWQFRGALSYYSALEILSNQFVPGLLNSNAAIPAQKFSAFLVVRPFEKVHFSVNGFYLSNKFGYSPFVQRPEEYASEIHINLFANCRHFLTRNLDLGIGVHNLLDGKYWYASWKVDANGSLDLPYQSREFFLKLTYSFQN